MAKKTKYQLQVNLSEAVGRFLDLRTPGTVPAEAPEITALIEAYDEWMEYPPAKPIRGIQG